MDSSQRPLDRNESLDSEADLNLLIYKTGKSLKRFILNLGRGLQQIWEGFILLLLYLLRNIGWLLLGFIIGLGSGTYLLYSNGSSYTSEATVKANFNSAASLYNSVGYFNSLINTGKADELAKIFGITQEQAKSLRDFSIAPVTSEIITADLYNDLFMKNDRSQRVRQDTFWRRTIKYDEFKEALKDEDYPYQRITVKAKMPSIYSQLEKGLVEYVSGNPLLQQIRNEQMQTNKEEERLISASISNLDSLRRAYNQRLISGKPVDAGSSSLTILNNNPEIKTPELELYDKMLELKDELRKLRKRAVMETQVLDVYTPFNPEGTKMSFIESIWQYALIGLEIAAGLLILKLVYSSLVAYGTTLKANKDVKKMTRKNAGSAPESF
jgi:hypothetical protein